MINIKRILTKLFKKKINKIKDSLNKQQNFNSLISEIIKKLEIKETSNYEEMENKKEENDNKDLSNDEDDLAKKKRHKFDENQEMAIDTNVPDLDNLAR